MVGPATLTSNGKPKGHRLERETFTTSRLMEFCGLKELATQIGHHHDEWPLVVLKELTDNALDICEESSIAPKIQVTVNDGGIAVQDNGPGIPATTVESMLNYEVRVSSREAYVSPTRGAQGNALKTLVAMPFALDGKSGVVEIEARGVLHIITFEVDHIRQRPAIRHEKADRLVKNGTLVRLHWPAEPRFALTVSKARFLQMAGDYAFLNPHLSLRVNWFGAAHEFTATEPGWKKWLPSDPTSAHWYSVESFVRLIAGYIAHDLDAGKTRLVRDLLAKFKGLTGTAVQKVVLDETGLSRCPLSDLSDGKAIDVGLAGKLLAAMKKATKPVKPAALGMIGECHVRRRLAGMGYDEASITYRSQKGETDGLPWVAEVAFGYAPDSSDRRRLITGLNWSAAVTNPYRQLTPDASLDGLLAESWAGEEEPVAVAVHVACPRIAYTDRGKSAASFPPAVRAALAGLVQSAVKRWEKQRRAEDRNADRFFRRQQAMRPREKRDTLKDVSFEVMEAAYLAASSGGSLPARARQVFYAARPMLLQRLDVESINDKYFTKTLLPLYIDEHPEAAAWDVVFDARGHLIEPHTGVSVPLGTLAVRGYLNRIRNHEVDELAVPSLPLAYPTCGPTGRYKAVLFVEKEGFHELFERVKLAQRYDVAIVSTKGTSVVAFRELVDALCSEFNIPLLLLHDFDKSGLSIASTLQRDTWRYSFKNEIKVIDFGLRLTDVEEWGLESEPVSYGKSDPVANLELNGATEAEIDFLCSGRNVRDYRGHRVELNAFTSDKLIAFIEKKLGQYGIKKVTPDDDMLDDAYRRACERHMLNGKLKDLAADVKAAAALLKLPKKLAGQIKAKLKADPARPWDAVLADLAAAELAKRK